MKICAKNVPLWSLIVVALIIALIFFPRFPETIVMEIGSNGASITLGRVALFYVPVIILLLCLSGGPFPFYDKRTPEPPKYAAWQLGGALIVLAAMGYVIYTTLF